jgi:hypothetical protein
MKEVSAFFIEKFAFEPVFESDWYTQLDKNGTQIGIMIDNSKNQPKFLHEKFNGNGFVLTIEISDIHEYLKKFNESHIIYNLKTEKWGQTHFIVKGPGQILIDVVEYTRPEDYK